MKNRYRTAALSLLLLAFSTPLVRAQSGTNAPNQSAPDVERRIAELQQQIEDLKAQVAAMKPSAGAIVPANSLVATSTPAAVEAAPLAGVASVLNGATVTGLLDTYYSYNANQPSSRVNGLRLFDARTNQFSFNLLELGLVKNPSNDARLGYNLTLGFGDAMNVVNAGDPSIFQYLKEAYVSYMAPVGKGLQIDAGKFVTPNGAEVIESNANWNYSRSLLFNYAIPFYHFGMRAKYSFNDKYALTGYVTNGWNNVVQDSANGFHNSGKTGGLSFAWTPNKKFSVVQNWMGGPAATPLDGDKWRNLFDTVVTYSVSPKLTLMANGDYGRVRFFSGRGGGVDWSGIAGYARYQFDPRYAVATRFEYYNDHTGFTTGTPQHINEFTETFERRIARHMISRLEYRHDTSNQPFFLKDGAARVKGQSTASAGLIFVLEPSETK